MRTLLSCFIMLVSVAVFSCHKNDETKPVDTKVTCNYPYRDSAGRCVLQAGFWADEWGNTWSDFHRGKIQWRSGNKFHLFDTCYISFDSAGIANSYMPLSLYVMQNGGDELSFNVDPGEMNYFPDAVNGDNIWFYLSGLAPNSYLLRFEGKFSTDHDSLVGSVRYIALAGNPPQSPYSGKVVFTRFK